MKFQLHNVTWCCWWSCTTGNKRNLISSRVRVVWVGFCRVDEFPSPKSHDHDVGLLDDKSVNETAQTSLEVVVNSETGAGKTKLNLCHLIPVISVSCDMTKDNSWPIGT